MFLSCMLDTCWIVPDRPPLTVLQLTIPSQHGRLRAGPELAAVALRGVRGPLPADALRQHLPLLRHDLQLLQD